MLIVPTQCVSLKSPVCLSEKTIADTDCRHVSKQNTTKHLPCSELYCLIHVCYRQPFSFCRYICRNLHFVLHGHSDDHLVCRLLWPLCCFSFLYAFLLFVFVFGNIKLFLSFVVFVFVSNIDS